MPGIVFSRVTVFGLSLRLQNLMPGKTPEVKIHPDSQSKTPKARLRNHDSQFSNNNYFGFWNFLVPRLCSASSTLLKLLAYVFQPVKRSLLIVIVQRKPLAPSQDITSLIGDGLFIFYSTLTQPRLPWKQQACNWREVPSCAYADAQAWG